jgi:hypothetical protein
MVKILFSVEKKGNRGRYWFSQSEKIDSRVFMLRMLHFRCIIYANRG